MTAPANSVGCVDTAGFNNSHGHTDQLNYHTLKHLQLGLPRGVFSHSLVHEDYNRYVLGVYQSDHAAGMQGIHP